jgi:hypothetical protein
VLSEMRMVLGGCFALQGLVGVVATLRLTGLLYPHVGVSLALLAVRRCRGGPC